MFQKCQFSTASPPLTFKAQVPIKLSRTHPEKQLMLSRARILLNSRAAVFAVLALAFCLGGQLGPQFSWAGGDGPHAITADRLSQDNRPTVEEMSHYSDDSLNAVAGALEAPTPQDLVSYRIFESVVAHTLTDFPDHEVVVFARDGIPIYDALQATLSKTEAGRNYLKKVHLVNLSRNTVGGGRTGIPSASPNQLREFVTQSGLDLNAIENGKSKVLFLDAQGSGTIYRKLMASLIDTIPEGPDRTGRLKNLVEGIDGRMIVTSGSDGKAQAVKNFETIKDPTPAQVKTWIQSMGFGQIIPPGEQKDLGFPSAGHGNYTWAVQQFERLPHWNGSAATLSDDGKRIQKYGDNPDGNRRASINGQRKLIQYFSSAAVQERFSPDKFPLALRDAPAEVPAAVAAAEVAPDTALIDKYYHRAAIAQENGTYPELLNEIANEPAVTKKITEQIAAELDRIKALPVDQRKAELNAFLSYDSKSAKGFKESALRLPSRIGVSIDDLAQGNFDSHKIATRLVTEVSNYEKGIVVPLLGTVEKELATDFPKHSIFFIGRDFTQAYIFSRERGVLPPKQLFTANISRYVRDAANAGNMAELQKLLDKSGLTKDEVLRDGVVFVDSSMNGKISAGILKALSSQMNGEESYRLLTNSHIRYVKSGRRDGASISDAAKAAGSATGKLTSAQVDQLLTRVGEISEFKLTLPAEYESEKGSPHRLFEHNPKFLSSATGFQTEKDSDVLLLSKQPEAPGKRVSSLLGLQSDLVLGATAKSSTVFSEIDAAAKKGRAGLTMWQDTVDPESVRQFAKMQVLETGDPKLPLELRFDGKVVSRFKKRLSEGNNVVAYLNENNEVVKVLKQAKNARKQVLQAWAQGVMDEYGIKTARVLSYEPHGLWLTMEYAPSESFEYKYGFTGTPLPDDLRKQILDDHERAKRLAKDRDIWLDQKAANYHLSAEGEAINVDFTPRLNSSYYRFFRDDAGNEFNDDQFLDLFLNYDIRKGIAKKVPPKVPVPDKCDMAEIVKDVANH